MTRRPLKWCDYCREGETDLRCSGEGCVKAFHKDCLRLSGDTWTIEEGEPVYHCHQCQEVGDGEDEHDEKCHLCKKKEGEDLFEFIMCSSCPKSHHLKCLGLSRQVEMEVWHCPSCKPEMNTVQVRLKGINRQKIGNVQICYVCQQGGRLLGCVQCPQSYHPKCIDGELLRDMNEDWNCPLCRGVDPLRNMKHRRLDKEERRVMSLRRQNHILKIQNKNRTNRDIFLYAQRRCIKQFVSEKTMKRLKLVSKKHRKSALSYHNIDVTIYDELEKALSTSTGSGFKSLLNEGVRLKPYQIYGVCWMLHAFDHKAGAILADEMGLGKTIQTLGFLSALRARGIEGPHLVVVPLSTVGNWVREIQKFTSHLSYTKICGSKSERTYAMNERVAAEGCVDVYITTYETVATEEWFFADDFKWATIILDEAHRIKSEKGAVRHSLDRVHTAFRILLTGTPLQNNVKELHTLLNFLFPDILTSGEEFEKAFMTGGQNSVRQPAIRSGLKGTKESRFAKAEQETALDIDESRMAAVCDLLKVLMLRRTKAEVVNLPPKVYHNIWLPLAKDQLKLYRGLLDMTDIDITEGKVKKMLGTIMKMRLTSAHPCSAMKSQDSKTKTGVSLALLKETHSFATQSASSIVIPQDEFNREVERIYELTGEEHVAASSKLVFLDKLLTVLHLQNWSISPLYREQYLREVKHSKAAGSIVPADEDSEKKEANEDSETNPLPTSISTKVVDSEGARLFRDDVYQFPLDGKQGKQWANAEEYKLDYERLLVKSEEQTPAHSVSMEDDIVLSASSDSDVAERPSLSSSAVPVENNKKEEKPRAHKILIFSQFRLVLVELEKYLQYRGFRFMRLDGSTNKMIRELDIREFNDESSTHLVYLIGTRAGGMGINLVTANHVMLFDEDWNPFVDMQAIDRAHRIGQSRRVHVWKVMTEWTVEERMAFRRAQKMKLDSKLIKARTEAAENEFAENQESHEKLAVDDVKKLLVYGSEAIRWLDIRGTPTDLSGWSIQDIMNRDRSKMPEDLEVEDPEEAIEEDSAEGVVIEESDTESRVLPISASNSIVDADVCPPPSTVDHSSDDTADNKVTRRRGTRIRKPTQVLYQPIIASDSKSRMPLRHEDRCFICQDKEFKKTITVKTDDKIVDTVEDVADDCASFIRCNHCPKVYHVGQCLGLPVDMKDRRNYRCQWHECSICYRKSSQAGGLLIHCAVCPTSFCFDCFPPEYRRFSPDPVYYENLVGRGFNAGGENFITYLCSRCKAMEQQKRRSMLDTDALKMELAAEKAEQHQLREDEKRMKEKAKSERENKAQTRQLEKERKKVLREEKEAERKLVMEEKLRRVSDVQKCCELAKSMTATIEGLFPLQSRTLFNDMLTLMEWSPGAGSFSKNVDTRIRYELQLGTKDGVKTCTNCYMPLHSASECPWPPEIRKISHYLSIERVFFDTSGVPSVPRDTPGQELFTGSDWTVRQEDSVIEIDMVTVPEVIPPHLTKEIYKKKMTRGFCSYCGLNAKEHSRRHCPNLDDVEREAYNRHKHDLGALILNLELYQYQLKCRLPKHPNNLSSLRPMGGLDPKIPRKLHPEYIAIGEAAKSLVEWRSNVIKMVADYVSLVSNAINLHHINCTNPEFRRYEDPIFDVIKSVSRSQKMAMYSRGKKRIRTEELISEVTQGDSLETSKKLKNAEDDQVQEVHEVHVIDDDTTPPVSNEVDLVTPCGPDTEEQLFGHSDQPN
eukprot:GHVH01004188.1.p1 GENE.GHVH01004188.1~~GHVH01004188.1.p1  ORF type:complete len:1724 (+),score=295.35 GHVH01004188.1:185-5356(+)